MATLAKTHTVSSENRIHALKLPPRLWVPCAEDVPEIGTHVRRGQTIAGTPAPAAGRIVGTSRQKMLGSSAEQMTAILEADPEQSAEEPGSLDRAAIDQVLKKWPASELPAAIQTLIQCGVRADRWTSPNLIEQLRRPPRQTINAVICGALDLDPVLPLQRTLITTRAVEVAAASALLARLVGAEHVFLAVPEDLHPADIAELRAASQATSVRLFPLPEEYPLAHPSLLIRRMLNRKVSPGHLPPDAGALVIDAPAAVAIFDCFFRERPMLEVPFGIYDSLRSCSQLVMVPVGMKLADVLSTTGTPAETNDLRVGHVLRELPASSEAIVAGGELTVFAAAAPNIERVVACVRCGWCVDACPARIHPAGLLDAAQLDDAYLADRYGLGSCIDCGICSFVCPSRLPLLSAIRGLRPVGKRL